MTSMKFLDKNISELEGWKWDKPIPDNDSSYVERKFYALHNVKLKYYDAESIRFMIGQGTGLKYLIPMAIKLLKKNIFIETDYYRGSLLEKVLEVGYEYWIANKSQQSEILEIIKDREQEIDDLDVTEDIKNILKKTIENYKARYSTI